MKIKSISETEISDRNQNPSELYTIDSSVIESINDLESCVMEVSSKTELQDVSSEEEKKDDIKNTTNYRTWETTYIAELFKNKGFIANEHWEKTININSRIAKYDNDYVICECLIDKENQVFEQRSFPRYLFDHIENLNLKPYVLLSIQSKIGSIRINVLKGDNLVDKKAFELKDEWDNLDGKDFNQPIDKPIQL